MKKVGGRIPDPYRRFRVIREPGTTAREGLVRGHLSSINLRLVSTRLLPSQIN